jgi:hypothetical protein
MGHNMGHNQCLPPDTLPLTPELNKRRQRHPEFPVLQPGGELVADNFKKMLVVSLDKKVTAWQ